MNFLTLFQIDKICRQIKKLYKMSASSEKVGEVKANLSIEKKASHEVGLKWDHIHDT